MWQKKKKNPETTFIQHPLGFWGSHPNGVKEEGILSYHRSERQIGSFQTDSSEETPLPANIFPEAYEVLGNHQCSHTI